MHLVLPEAEFALPNWWFYSAGQPSSTTTALSLPLHKGKGEENMTQRAQGLRLGQGDHSTIIITGKTDSAWAD